MDVFREATLPPEWRGSVLAIGNFDGVHLGHRAMLSALVRNARVANTRALVFTFDPHPLAFLRPDLVPPALTTMSRRLELIAETGVDGVLVYPTDTALLELTAEAFFDDIIRGRLDARGLVEGPNFCFGKNRGGTIERLREFCHRDSIGLDVVEPVELKTRMVSSTTVRQAILEGDVDEANRLLASRYQIEGTVVEGDRRGRTIGFPTANLSGIETVLPRDGVYSGRTRIGDEWWPTAMNVGPNPTFAEQRRKIEAHVIGYRGDLYGARLRFEFVARLRETRKFDGIESLKRQLEADIHRAIETVSADQREIPVDVS